MVINVNADRIKVIFFIRYFFFSRNWNDFEDNVLFHIMYQHRRDNNERVSG